MGWFKNITLAYYKQLQLRSQAFFRAQKEDARKNAVLHYCEAYPWVISGDTFRSYNPQSKYWNITSGVSMSAMRKRVSPKSLAAFDHIRKYGEASGMNCIRIYAAFDPGFKQWHWYEVRFNSTEENVKRHYLLGITKMVDKEIAEEKQLKEWQETINKSLINQSYLCNISHDIRTPLNAVTGFSQLITCSELDSTKEELAQYNASIKENASMMLNMIDSVTGKSHMKPDELSLRPMAVSANSFINQSFSTHKILCPAHIRFLEKTETEDKKVNIDPILTRQVLNNFLSNAYKFTHQGSITIGWKSIERENKVMFFCKDTGIGITEENAKHLWNRYFKVDETDMGTGLGLHISKNIIEQENGEIGVNSKFGEGSTFWFKFDAL